MFKKYEQLFCGFSFLLLVFVFVTNTSLLLQAQTSPSPTYFEQVFGIDTVSEKALGVKQLESGSIFMAGYTNNGLLGKGDITLSKLTPNGTLLWTRYYGTAAYNDYCNAMIINQAGNFVLVGKTDADENTKGILLEIDTLGNVVQAFQSNYQIPVEVYEYIQPTTDGGYIVAGFSTQASGTFNDMLLLKFDNNFVEQWRQNFGGLLNDVGYSVQNTSEGGIIIAGDSHSYSPHVAIYVVKTDASGNFEWDLLISTDYATGVQNIITTNNGDYFLVGESSVDAGGAFDVIMARINPVGQLLWTNFWGGSGTDAGFAVQEADDGAFYICGYSTTLNPDAPYEILWLKTDSAGNEISHQYFQQPSIDIAYDFFPSIYGGWLIAGLSTLNGNGQYYLVYTAEPVLTNIEPLANMLQTIPNPIFLTTEQEQTYCNLNLPYSSSVLYLQLCDIWGRVVYMQKWKNLSNSTHTLLLSNLPATLPNGVYFFRIDAQLNLNSPSPQYFPYSIKPAVVNLGAGKWCYYDYK